MPSFNITDQEKEMIPIAKLREQHDEISELAQVLLLLIRDDTTRGARVVRQIFQQLADLLYEHFELEEKTLYAELLNHKDKQIRDTAWRFVSGAPHLKKFFSLYARHWCDLGDSKEECDAFINESEEIFHILSERVKVITACLDIFLHA